MKHVAKFRRLAVVAAMALLCMAVLSACGGKKWPESYSFKGQLTSGTGSADIIMELNADNTLTLEGLIHDETAGKWSGTWKQNEDGTLEITFASAESEELDPAPAYGMTLNDAETDLGGMGGLTVTSTIDEENINTVEVKINVAIGDGYTMAFDGTLVQEPASEE